MEIIVSINSKVTFCFAQAKVQTPKISSLQLHHIQNLTSLLKKRDLENVYNIKIHFILIDQSYEIYSENLSHFVMSWLVEGNLLRTV